MDENDIIKTVNAKTQLDDFSRQIKTVNILGQLVSNDVLIIKAVWFWVIILLWYLFGIFGAGKAAIAIFSFQILLLIYQVFNHASDTETSVLTAMDELSHMIMRIEGFFGIVVLVYLYVHFTNQNSMVFTILTLAMLLLSFSIVYYAFRNDSIHVRNIRILAETIFNSAVLLFVLAVYLIAFNGRRSRW